MLVHYPGHYCWQHTSQAPKEPAKPRPKKGTEQYFSSTSSYKPATAPTPPIPVHPVRVTPTHAPTLETTLKAEEETEQRDTVVHTALISCQQTDIHPPVPEIYYSDSSSSDTDEEGGGVGDLGEDSGFWEESPENDNVSSDPTTCTVGTLPGDDEDEESQAGYDQVSSVGDLPDMLPQDLLQADEPVVLLNAPELEVPTHFPERPVDNTPLQLNTWTVVELHDEPKHTYSITEKPKKSKGIRSCGLGWVVNALLSPFKSARKDKILMKGKEITTTNSAGLHDIGFSTATQKLLASLTQETSEYIYLAASLPNATGHLRIKLGHTNGPLEPSTDQQACELTTIWRLPVANAARVERLALMAVKSEFDGGQSRIPFILAIESYVNGVQCPCTKTHQDIFVTTSAEYDWLKDLVIRLDKLDRAERRRDSWARELKVSVNVEPRPAPVVEGRVRRESAATMREHGAIAA